MLYGRREERAQIASLLAGARGGHAGVLVVRGEAGIGKHALLQDAAEQANGFRLLRATGVQADIELAFAGLHQLLGPVLDRLDRLPAPQAQALQGAFGLVETQTETNRFLVELGALSLLAVVAAEQPLLCLVAQARWLDSASADAVVFVARRLTAEPIVVLFAARDGEVRRFQAPGLPELCLGGLDLAAAGELLAAQVGMLAPQVRDRLVGETGGNPLALLELPAGLSSEQLAGRELLPQRLPLSARLQQVFLARVRTLPEASRTLLVVAAAEDTGQLATVLAAGRALGIGPEALEPAEQAGLVHFTGSQLVFRHPLVRSAIYQAATFTARQAAHEALVGVLVGGQQADRRAWHLAAGTLGKDEQVAGALEGSAERAYRRGGPAAAAAALVRAAALTPAAGPRTRRLVAAAEYLWEAGHPQEARALLDRVEPESADPGVRARVAQTLGAVELATGIPALASTLLVEGAKLLLGSDPARATHMLVVAARAALAAGDLDLLVNHIHPSIVGLNARRPGQEDVRVQRVVQSLLAAGLVQAQPTGTVQGGSREVATVWPHPAFTWIWPTLIMAEPANDEFTADQVYSHWMTSLRAAGTVSNMTVALANLTLAEASMGRWPDAHARATEGLRLATETGQHTTRVYFVAWLAWFAAHQGRGEECRQLADEVLATATARRMPPMAAFAGWTLAQLDLAEGRPAAALEQLVALATPGHPSANGPIALLATRELAEAAANIGQLDGIVPKVERFERWAESDRRVWSLVVARRSRALITQGADAEQHYQAALGVVGLGERPIELAHTELAYGQWLRRARRRADARSHLRTALTTFERLGAARWAERARSELRASGETTRTRDPTTLTELTAQERQVARLASQGLTNQQIADRLYLSPHTVGYHLHKVYAKLGIISRAQLHDLGPGDDPER